MKRISRSAACFALLTTSGTALAAPVLRVQQNQHGDFLLVGNTLGFDCAAGVPLPVVGTLAPDACAQSASNINDSSPDVFWEADAPAAGEALADTSTLPTAARSTAVLTVPPGATVTNAFLYWAATNVTGVADTQVTLDRVGAGGFGPTVVTALQSWVPGVDDGYQSVADITALVQANGSGAYRVSDIDVAPFANVDKDVLFGGFWIVALYENPTDPLRNLALFDGFDVVKSGSNQSATLSGFLVPSTGFTGKLGVVAFEGDNTGTGDSLFFNNVKLSDAQNPSNNFFNSTRSWLGLPLSVMGDLPQLTGTPGSLSGVDLDVVDITAELTKGQSSAPLQATTSGDTYYLGGFITSLSTFAPDLSGTTKTATDLNGGLLFPGDVVRYTITVSNAGNDASSDTVLSDPLPPQVTFVPGSITVDGVAETDATGDDLADFVTASDTIAVRLGMGAGASQGGSLGLAATTVVTFDVTINGGVTGDVANQGSVAAGGLLGAPVGTTLTDGNGSAPGSPPTVVTVSPCTSSSDCTMADPVCDMTLSPPACVECVADGDCGDMTSGKVCGPTLTCINGCRGTGGNGCLAMQVCTSTTSAVGTCRFALDAGMGDAGMGDASVPMDASDATVDAGMPDTGAGDTGAHDSAMPDAGARDTGPVAAPDAGHDAGVPSFDGGQPIIAEGGGCDCTLAKRSEDAGPRWMLGALGLGLFFGRRRRRR